MDRDARLGVRIITAAPDINGVLDAVQYTNSTNVASCSLWGIGTVYRIASAEYMFVC
jgi:hypothetical protein